MDDRALHARTALEQVCARGDLERAREIDGRIAEDWTVSDNLGLLRQIGVRRALALAARYLRGARRR